MTDWQRIADDIGKTTGEPFAAETPRSLGGGCINTAVKLCDGARCYFVKINDATRIAMFEAERDGLAEMASAQAVRVPQAVLTGSDGRESWIVMEYVAMGRPASASQVEAGRQLAAMHRQVADAFGWHRDNTIGSTPQVNHWTADWIDFWRVHRLGFQLELAASHGHGGRLTDLGNRVLEALPALLAHGPEPSLLHGDLWGGNIGYDGDGHPVLFDPAVYYGDREADLAMTELFGGFSGDFYAAYGEAWPIDPGYKVRKTLYNLYHILNHLNLFGGGYAGQATGMMERILGEI
jgi:fructosamine-3-kinase